MRNKVKKVLTKWRKIIADEVDCVGVRPYSHNIINITLQAIAEEFGKDKANKAIVDFGLDELGWKEVEK